MTVWTVPATVLRVVDADTLEVLLDLGWRLTLKTKVRLAGVNAPERNTPGGVLARHWVFDQLANVAAKSPVAPILTDFRPITVVSHSLDKYGRVLGDVLYDNAAIHGVHKPLDQLASLGAELLAAGHAVPMR